MAVFTATALIGAAVASGFAVAAGTTVFGLGVLASAAVIGGASLALSAASTLLAPKPKAASYSPIDSNQTQSVRQAITAHRIIYGEMRVGGAITYLTTTETNKYVHVAYVLAAHEVQSVGTIYLGDDAVHTDMLDGSGVVTSGQFNNKARLKKHLGQPGQVADADLIAAAGLDSNFRGQGVAYVYARYQPDQTAYPNGMPNLSAQVRGVKLYDPRDGQTRWNPNPALAWRDYMTAAYGMGATAAEIDDEFVKAAANACEEIVTTLPVESVAESVSAGDDWIVMDEDALPFETGDRIRVSSSATMPGGLAPATDYYAVPAHYTDKPAVKFATSYANALAGTTIDITSAGSGTIKVTKNGEPRYTCNGVIETDQRPVDMLSGMLASMGGRAVYSGGKWRIYAAVWMAPTVTLDEDDLRGEVVLQTNHSMRELFNAVQGTYTAAANFSQATNYPAVTNSVWQAQDGGVRKFTQLDLSFTNRAQTCQRLAKIELERHRRQMSADISATIAGMLVQAGENMGLTFSDNGWVDKSFEIVAWAMGFEGAGGDGLPMLLINMSLREVDAACFEFDETTEEVQPAPAPTTNFPSAFSAGPPSNLTLTSGTAALFTNKDGTIVSRVWAQWTDSPDGFADHYEFQVKRNGAVDWEPAYSIPQGVGQNYIWGAEDGDVYDARIRTVSVTNVRSVWVTVTGHTVEGKSVPPSDVAGLNAQQNGNVVNISWPPVADADLNGYELRYMAAPFIWERANALTRVTRGTQITAGYIPPGTWVVGIKAVDTSGNYSVNETLFGITVTNDNDIVVANPEGPWWLGTLNNLVRHDVSGRLVPKSQNANSSTGGWDVFDKFVLNPPAEASYEASMIDLGADFTGLRVYANIEAGLGPLEVGYPNGTLQIDYRLDAGSFDGYEDWTLGIVDARYIKSQVITKSAEGVNYIQQFTPVIDLPEFNQSGSKVVLPGGTRIDYPERFFKKPYINVTAQGSTALYATYAADDEAGFTAHVFNASGVDVGGTVNWIATGI